MQSHTIHSREGDEREIEVDVESAEPIEPVFSWKEMMRFVGPGLLMSIAYVASIEHALPTWHHHAYCSESKAHDIHPDLDRNSVCMIIAGPRKSRVGPTDRGADRVQAALAPAADNGVGIPGADAGVERIDFPEQ